VRSHLDQQVGATGHFFLTVQINAARDDVRAIYEDRIPAKRGNSA